MIWRVAISALLLAGGLCACRTSRPQAESVDDSGQVTAAAAAPSPKQDNRGKAEPAGEPVSLPEGVKKILDERGMALELPQRFVVEQLDAHSRFQLKARPHSGAFELRYSFGAKQDDTSAIEPMLARVVYVFTHNFARQGDSRAGDAAVCNPVEEPPEVVNLFGADRVFHVCFQPADYLGGEFRSGIAYWLFKKNRGLVAIVALTNDPMAGAADIGPALFALKFR